MDPVTQTVDGIRPPPPDTPPELQGIGGPDAVPQAEEPQAEEPQAEEPQAEEPQAEEPQAEEPQAEAPPGETMVGDAGVAYVAPAEADLDAEGEPPVL